MCSRTLLRMMHLVPSALLMVLPVVASAQLKPRIFTVKSAGAPASSNAAQIRDYLGGLPPLMLVNPNPGRPETMVGLPEGVSGTRWKDQQIVNTQAELALLKSYPDVAWPGALVQGATINNNNFAQINLPRSGGTIRLATEFIDAATGLSQSVNIPEMTATAVNDARRALLQKLAPKGSTGQLLANLESAETLREAMVKLGVAYQGTGFSASLDAGLNSSYNENTVVAKFTQVFYSVEFEPSGGESPFFAPSVTLQDVKGWATAANPPLFVSEVKYGRILLASFTSNMSQLDLQAAVRAAYSGFSVNGAASYKDKFSTVRMDVLSVGGRPDQVVGTVIATSVDSLKKALEAAIRNGITYDPQKNPGDAIALTMRYVGSRTAAAGPYLPAIAQMMTQASPHVVDLSSKRVCTQRAVWDGVGGGPLNTHIRVAPGDEVTFEATGTNWSGVFASGDYGPEGWHTWDRPKDGEGGYQITDRHPFALIAKFGGSNTSGPDRSKDDYRESTARVPASSWFFVGTSAQAVAGWTDTQSGRGWPGVGDVWLGTNDNIPTNGDANKKFQVTICVKRNPYNPASAY